MWCKLGHLQEGVAALVAPPLQRPPLLRPLPSKTLFRVLRCGDRSIPNESVPANQNRLTPAASKQKGSNLNRFKNFRMNAKAGIWP